MFPVTSVDGFKASYTRIYQDFAYWSYSDADSVASGLNRAFAKALLSVRTIPEAYPRTSSHRRFFFEYKSVPLTVYFTFEDETVTLLDIVYSRSGRAAERLSGL